MTTITMPAWAGRGMAPDGAMPYTYDEAQDEWDDCVPEILQGTSQDWIGVSHPFAGHGRRAMGLPEPFPRFPLTRAQREIYSLYKPAPP